MAEEVRFSDTILGNIVKDATINWDYEHSTMEEKVAAAQAKVDTIGMLPTVAERVSEAKNTVGISVDDSIKGIAEVAGLSEDEKRQLTEDINTKGRISPELAQKVAKAFEMNGKESSIIKVLSIVHDGWVRDVKRDPETNEIVKYNNGRKFEDPGRMKKLYQFTPLQLLNFGEAKLDLLFLKPLLDNMGIEVDEQTLETVFLQEQQAFLDAHGIKDTKDLKAKLQEGAAFYPALEGIKGATGDLITDRLAAEDFSLDMMTEQVAKNARVPEKAKETVDLDQVQEVAETLTKSVADKTTLDIRTSETPGKDDKAVEEQGE